MIAANSGGRVELSAIRAGQDNLAFFRVRAGPVIDGGVADHGDEDRPGCRFDFGREFFALVLQVGEAEFQNFVTSEGCFEALVEIGGQAVLAQVHGGRSVVGEAAKKFALGVGKQAGH